MHRRALLKRGLFGGTLLAAGSLGIAFFPTEIRHKPRRALRVLDETRFAVLAAISARTVIAPNADPVEIAHRMDDWLAISYPEVQADVKQLLTLFESALAGLFLDGRPRPFTRLSPAEQDAALAEWRDSRLVLRRSAYVVLRKLTQRAHYMSPDVWASVGYGGPPEIAEG